MSVCRYTLCKYAGILYVSMQVYSMSVCRYTVCKYTGSQYAGIVRVSFRGEEGGGHFQLYRYSVCNCTGNSVCT